MAQSTLEMILKVTDKASAELKKVNGSMGSLRDVTKAAGTAVGIFAAIAGTTAKGMIDLANGAEDYVLEMADLAIKTGTTAEEMSRLVQVGDDLRIEQQSIELAFRNMAQNGIQPTLANLKLLADEYNKIGDPVKRAQFAMENFGARSGQEMQKLLDVGGAALDDMAAQVDEFGLVVSEADRIAAQAYYSMKDSFSDMADGFKKEVGVTIMPVLTAWMGGVMAAKKEYLAQMADLSAKGPPTILDMAIAIAKAGAEWRNMQAAAAGAVDEVGFLKNALDQLKDKHVTVTVSTLEIGGYGSKYMPVGSGGGSGGYAGFVTTGGSGFGPRVEGPGGKFYRMNYSTGLYEPAQHGWEGVIPPGYPNDSFKFGVSSGEHVEITPAGRPSSGGGFNVGVLNINNRLDALAFNKEYRRVMGAE